MFLGSVASPPAPASPPAAGRLDRGLVALVAAFFAWAGWFVFRTSFVLGGVRHFTLFDDAMISMTYARNFVEGHGLVWARSGAAVEGFSNPLWTFLMIPVNALPLALEHRSLVVQAASLLILAGHVVLVHRLVARHFSAGPLSTALPAAVLTAFYYPLDYWGLVGMETGLQALLATAAVYLVFEIVYRGRRLHGRLFAVLAAAYLARMDMTLLIVAVLAFALVERRGVPRAERRAWIAGTAVLALVVAVYQAFRWAYFGDPLPNPYYLKLTGIPLLPRLLRGLSKYTDFVRASAVPLLAVGVGALPRLGSRPRWRLPAALFALYSLYSVWVGGDAWEMHNNMRANRFVAFVMPMLFVLANAVLNEAIELGGRRFALHRRRLFAAYAAAAVTTLLVFLFDGLWLAEREADNWRAMAVTELPLLVASHQVVLVELREFESLVAPGAEVATCWAGIPAYFSDYRMVDVYGVNDRRIARGPAAVALRPGNFDKYTPGHAKWDFAYTVGERRPDALFQAWTFPAAELESHGYEKRGDFWLQRDSPKVRH